MRARDDDPVRVLFDFTSPPLERLARDRACRPAPDVPAAFGWSPVIAIAEHEKQNVAGDEAVALPVTFDRERPALAVHLRVLGIESLRIDPFPEPPLRVFAGPARIVVAEQMVDLLDTVLLRRRELRHDRR